MYSVDTVVPDNNDTQCNTLLLDNIVLINTITNWSNGVSYIVIVSKLIETMVYTNNDQWLGGKVHTMYGTHYPPPPPINIKPDLGFPQEWPLKSGKFRKNLMPDYFM